MRVKDWVVLTPAAAQTFWSFLFRHSSQIDKVRWRGSVVDPLTLLLPEQAAKLRNSERWMLRIVDVIKALSLRGKFILAVADGRGKVIKGGRDELKLHISALAPLYSGLYSPQQLQIAGKISAPEGAIFAATQLFPSVSPWMPDFF